MTTTETAAFPPSAAQQYLAENQDRLLSAVIGREQVLRVEAAPMSKDEIREALERDAADGATMGVTPPAKSAPKSEYVEAFVRRFSAKSDESAALRAARDAVDTEARVMRDMRDLIAERDEQVVKLREALAHDAPRVAAKMTAYRLEWHADTFQATVAAAEMAERYIAARERGSDPRILARELAREVLEGMDDHARSGQNLRMDSHGIARMAKAQAQRHILKVIKGLLGDDVMSVLGYF